MRRWLGVMVYWISHTIRTTAHCREEDHEECCRIFASVQQVANGFGAAVAETSQALGEAEPGGQTAGDRHEHVLLEAEVKVRISQPTYRIEAHNVVMIGHAGDQRVHLVAHPKVGKSHVMQRRRYHATHQAHCPPACGPIHNGQRVDQQRYHNQGQGQWEHKWIVHIDQVMEEEAQHGERPQEAKGAGNLEECRRLQMAARVDLKD